MSEHLYAGMEQFIPRLKKLPPPLDTPPVFKTCTNGHDLTTEWSHLYANGGNRACRECSIGPTPKKKISFSMQPIGSRFTS
jgi:hypothetical protein